MLTLSNVSLAYGNGSNVVQALLGINLDLQKGKSYAVIGPSGCGKTSLLYLMAGLIQPTEGKLYSSDQQCLQPKKQTAVILQEYGLLPWKTVWENAVLGLKFRKLEKAAAEEILSPILAELGLTECLDRYPSQLSGGQKQRVALARALALQPELLLMDEPLSALDALTRENLQELILHLWVRYRITFVLVTHSIEEAVFLGREIIILSHRPGEIRKIVTNPHMGTRDFRHDPCFYEKCSEIRTLLEDNIQSEYAVHQR